MIKVARQGHEEESQQLPYYNKRNPDLCARSYDSYSSQHFHSSSIHRNTEKNQETYGVASKPIYNDLTDTSAAGQPPIVNSMASPLANYMNQLQKVCYDSQESNDSNNRLKSPWSVYGSKNSSPCTYKSPRLQENSYESPRISENASKNPRKPVNREGFEENEKSSLIEEQLNYNTKAIGSYQNKYELIQNKPLNPYQSAGVSTSSVSESMLNPIALRLACPSLGKSKSNRHEGETELCNLKEIKASVNYDKVNVIEATDFGDKRKENLLVKGNTDLLTLEEKKKGGNEVKVDDKEETNIRDKPHENLLESKRSMTEIMSLLKGKQTVGKSASNGVTHKHTTNQSLNSVHSQDDRLKADEKTVKVADMLGDKITKEFYDNTDDLENTKSDINSSKFEASDLQNDSVMLDIQSEIEFHNAENNATFTISFSPLSNVTCSDDEDDNVKQNTKADNESVLDHNFNKQSDTSDNKEINRLTSLSESKRNDIKFRTSSQSDAHEDKVLGHCISSISVSDSYGGGDLNSFITEPETNITNMNTSSETRNDHSDCPSFASPADNKLRSNNECRDFYADQADILWCNSEHDVNNDGFGNIIADDKEICKSTSLVEQKYEKNEESDKAVRIKIDDEVSCTTNNSFERKSPLSAFNDTNISKPTENSSPFIPSVGKDKVETNQIVEGDLVIGTPEQDIPEERDFIDLIDSTKQNSPNVVENSKAETLNVESSISDKTYNESIDKKMTQSQDTLDYSCDTLSSSHSQQFSSAGLKAVPEIELKRRVPLAHSPGSNDLVCYRSANLNKIVAHHSLNQDETLQEPFCRNLSRKELKESAYGSVGCKSSNKDDSEFHSGICYKDNDVDKQGLMNIVLKSRENLHNSLHKDERGKEAVNFWQNEFANSVESKQDCESLLTQIDNIHDVNGSHLAAEEQLVKRKDTGLLNLEYCKFGNFCENFIFPNSVKRHICKILNSRLWHDLPTPVKGKEFFAILWIFFHKTSHMQK